MKMFTLTPGIRASLVDDIRGVIEEINDHDPVGGSDLLGAFKGLEALVRDVGLDGGERALVRGLMRLSFFTGRASALTDVMLGALGKGTKGWPAEKVVRWKNVAWDAYCVLMPRG